ncbi:MAG: hypothetical protein ACTHZ9_08140 [Leucobacter sp.]
MSANPLATSEAVATETATKQQASTSEHEQAVAGQREPAADRFMRKLLRAEKRDRSVTSQQAAHRGFRVSLVVTGIRCLITYVLIPVLVPIVSFADVVAAPVGIALCIVAVVSGIISVRRFWISDHRGKWMYTIFIAIVFAVVLIAFVFDVKTIVTGS